MSDITPAEKLFQQLVKEHHGIDVPDQFIADQHRLCFEANQAAELRWREIKETGIELYRPDIRAGRIGRIVLAIAVGVVVGVLTGGAGFALPAALLAASIAYQVGGLIFNSSRRQQTQQQDQAEREEQFAQSFSFQGATSLQILGAPIPRVFCSQERNPSGGVWLTDPPLIDSRIVTLNGAQYLEELAVLGAGVVQLVDEGDTELDGQRVGVFLDTDVEIQTTNGSETQAALVDGYSQVVTLATNRLVGVTDRVRSTTADSPVYVAEPWINRIRVGGTTPGGMRKNATGATGYGSSEGKDVVQGPNGRLCARFTVTQNDRAVLIGFSRVADTPSRNNTLFGVDMLASGSYRVWLDGSADGAAVGSYSTGDVFEIWWYDGNNTTSAAQIYRNGALRATRLDLPSVSRLKVDAHLTTENTTVSALEMDRLANSIRGAFTAGIGTMFQCSDDGYSRFNAGEQYRVLNQNFTVTNKDATNNRITVSRSLIVPPATRIYSVNDAVFETTKEVERIDVNLDVSLFARNDDGDVIEFGMAFEVRLSLVGDPVNHTLGILFISGANPNGQKRAFSIWGMTRGIYKVELRSLTRDQINDGDSIWSVGDDRVISTRLTGITIDGNQVRLDMEGFRIEDVARVRNLIDKGTKFSTAAENGPTGQISSINERITSGPDPRYPGLALAHTKLIAGPRIQNSPSRRWHIAEGSSIRNHVAAGIVTTGSSGGTLIDVNARFVIKGIQVGYIVRNLTKRIQGVSTAVTNTTMTLPNTVTFSAGDRYVVYFNDASTYFPDLYVNRLIAEDGLGEWIDGDRFIDYQSIVAARDFCVLNQFFWDGRTDEGLFEEWANEAAPQSLLYATLINGVYGLIPECPSAPTAIFNEHNVSSYETSFVPWPDSLINTLLLTYTGRDGRKEQRLVQTADAAAALETEVIQSIEMPGITRQAQADRVGSVTLNGLRKQRRTITIETDIEGVYVQPADLIKTQHVITEYDNRYSGQVVGHSNLSNPGRTTLPATANIIDVLPSGPDNSVVVCDCPHQLRDGDLVEVTGRSENTFNRIHVVLRILDDYRLLLESNDTAGTGGRVAPRRETYTQWLILSSDLLSLSPSNKRISVMHQSTMAVDVDLIYEMVGGAQPTTTIRVFGLSQPIEVGDVWNIGLEKDIDLMWRISEVDPDITANTVRLQGVVWRNDLDTKDGLVFDGM